MLDFYIYHLNGKKQFIPTSEDVKNEDLKKLANQLKGDSDKQMLTSILEWQHKNISYWMERGILETSWIFLRPIYYFICTIVFALISIVIYVILVPVLGTEVSIKVGFFIFIILLIWAISQGTLINLMLPLVFFYPLYIIMKTFVLNSPSKSAFEMTITSFNGVLFGASLFTLIYITLSYLPLFRRDPIKTKLSKLSRIIKSTFELSIPVGKILEYKLAICRDYAKLTAALLLNCGVSKVYFFMIQSHVATAVKIKDKYYILDQNLPVLTKDGWFKRWEVKEANVYTSKLARNLNSEITGVSFKKMPISIFSAKDGNAINAAELADKVSELLGINQSSQKDIPDFDFTLKNYAVYYEDDDIVKYSLTIAIKNKLENEFCGNIDKISKIEINQCENDKDLNLLVYL